MEKLFNHLIIFGLIFNLSSCSYRTCKYLPSKFDTYQKAIIEVKSTDFEIEETLNTEKSTWIKSTSFYSCDSKTGFLIIRIRSTNYIHQNVPLSKWNEFKKTDSFGNYYNRHIKGNFKLAIN